MIKKKKRFILIILFFIIFFINFSNISHGEPGDVTTYTMPSNNTDKTNEKQYPEYKYTNKNLPNDKKELKEILKECEERKAELQRNINLLPDTSQTKQTLKNDLNKLNTLMKNINEKISEIEKQDEQKNENSNLESEEKNPMGQFNPESWAPESTTEVTEADKLQRMGNIVIGTIRTIASILSVLVLIIIGIKYMFGSAEEKAEYKKTMLPYVIGAILVFGITNILSIVEKIAGELLK